MIFHLGGWSINNRNRPMMRPCISLTVFCCWIVLISYHLYLSPRSLPIFHCLSPYFFISPYSMAGAAFPMNFDGAKIKIHSALFVVHCDNMLSCFSCRTTSPPCTCLDKGGASGTIREGHRLHHRELMDDAFLIKRW